MSVMDYINQQFDRTMNWNMLNMQSKGGTDLLLVHNVS